jgi:Hypothetical glycosyl hydrolase 6
MSEWYEHSFRRNLVDMHIEDWDDGFLRQFDPEAYFRNLQSAHVASPMIYIQSHVGYCYWPAKTGHVHRAFKGREDAMKRLFDLCHGAGMQVIAYYSLIYNNWAYETHPEWRMVSSSGQGSRENGSRYGLCCPNNVGYRGFVREQIEDFSRYFDFESIFFDMTFWPMICYCESCKARWSAEHGGDIPKVINWTNRDWVAFQEKRQEWLGEFAGFATGELKKQKPGCSVEHQYSTAMHFWRFGVNENIAKASDYAGGDLYGGLAEQSFACKLYYNATPHQPFEYMTSRCYPNLEEHTTTKSTALLSLSVMTTLFHHGACVMIDAIDPRGTMDARVYARLGEAYSDAARYEPALTGDLVQDVGIYYDLNGKMDVEQPPAAIGSAEAEVPAQPHQVAALGAAAVLRERHIPFGVVNNWRSDLLKKLSVLVLPDVPMMGTGQMQAVADYVKEGGRLYLSGHSAWDLVEKFFGSRPVGFTQEKITYVAPTELGEPLLPGFTRDYPMALHCRQVLLSGTVRGEVLATVTLPYTVPTDRHAAGVVQVSRSSAPPAERSPRFASIHSNPPGKQTQNPAILRTTYGKGVVLWAAAPLEAAGRPPHGDVVAALIRSLGGPFSFQSDAPDVVELILFSDAKAGRRTLGILNLQDRFNPLPVGGFQVSIRMPRRPSQVRTVPEQESLPFSYSDGQVFIGISGVALYRMLEIID